MRLGKGCAGLFQREHEGASQQLCKHCVQRFSHPPAHISQVNHNPAMCAATSPAPHPLTGD